MSEPITPEAIAERARRRQEDDAIDAWVREVAEFFSVGLAADVRFVLIVAKERDHYVHLCTAGSVTSPREAVRYLEKALADMKANLQ